MEEQDQNRRPAAGQAAGGERTERPKRRRSRPGGGGRSADGDAQVSDGLTPRTQGNERNRRRERPWGGENGKGRTVSEAGSTPGGRPETSGAPANEPGEGRRGSRGENEPANRRAGGKNRSKGKQPKPEAKEPARGGERRSRKENQKARRGGYGLAKRGLEDIYGTPTEADVMTLEDLRARIVLQAADGSIPAAQAAPKSGAEPEPAQGSEAVAPTADAAALPSPSADAETPAEETVEVVGVRFRSIGKVYSFDPRGISLHYGEYAVVETARGPEFGEVSFGNRMVSRDKVVLPLRPVLRVATEEDIAHNAENRAKEKEALTICQEKIRVHQLDMKLIDAQYAFDNSQLLFYFTSDGRVDFRALVKDLASVFRTRIELRQIGIRDEAKMLGGLGACGRPLCCATFLSDVVQVSIKMAKEQNLALNSAKISGVCGRLMCCLRYEADMYTEEIRLTPPHGSTVKTADGIGTVISTNPLAGTVRVVLQNMPDATPKQYSRDEVTLLARRGQEVADKNN